MTATNTAVPPAERPLTGRVALVTGGSRGIGQAVALALADAGARVMATARRDEEGCQETVRQIAARGGSAAHVLADASLARDVDAMVEACVGRFGGIDILVNAAGMQVRGSFLEATESDWDASLAANLTSTFLSSQRTARAMIAAGRGGAIVNIASHAGLRYIRGMSPQYQVAKAGIIHLTRCMGVELAAHRIRANAIAPGLVDTHATRGVLADPARHAQLVAQIPLGRVGRPDDVAGVAVFLASPASGWMTGETIVVNGGQSAW